MKKRFSMKVKEVAVVLFTLTLVLGCGNQAPYGTEITISPDSCDLNASSEYTVFKFFDIKVTNDGVPLNGVEIEISFIFAPPLPEPAELFDFIYLLDEDLNRQDSPFITETGENGAYRVWVEIITVGDFYGDLEVSTGNAYASVEINIDRTDIN